MLAPVSSFTNCAHTFCGVGSGTAIGSAPAAVCCWRMLTLACALIAGTLVGPPNRDRILKKKGTSCSVALTST